MNIPANPVLLECLAHLAWCDGFLMDEEAELLENLFEQMELPQPDRQRLLSGPHPLPSSRAIGVACPDPGTRKEFLKVAYRLASIDEELSEEEWAPLGEICKALSLKIHNWEDLKHYLDTP